MIVGKDIIDRHVLIRLASTTTDVISIRVLDTQRNSYLLIGVTILCNIEGNSVTGDIFSDPSIDNTLCSYTESSDESTKDVSMFIGLVSSVCNNTSFMGIMYHYTDKGTTNQYAKDMCHPPRIIHISIMSVSFHLETHFGSTLWLNYLSIYL